jgi:hypothetical protein
MVFEGLVIHRTPYKERDLIAKLILRNGLVGSFYIYGGQGGGKHSKPSVFEPGTMMRIHQRDQRARSFEGSELIIAGEHSRLWGPEHIRHDVRAFYLSCLYFEVVRKFSSAFQLGESDYQEASHQGIFSVLSNAIFYLDESLAKGTTDLPAHLLLFLVKLLYHLGITPETDSCGLCGSELAPKLGPSFIPAAGHFGCRSCVTGEDHGAFRLRIKQGYQTRYQDHHHLQGTNFREADMLLHYLCHQFQTKPIELKSYGLLFK